MIAECDDQRQPDRYYSPSRVRALLRLYTYLTDARPPRDDDLEIPLRVAFGPGGWQETAACKHVDISRALAWLGGRDERAEYVVRAYFVVGLPYRAIADYLSRHYGLTRSDETIRRWTLDGVDAMAEFLGWHPHHQCDA